MTRYVLRYTSYHRKWKSVGSYETLVPAIKDANELMELLLIAKGRQYVRVEIAQFEGSQT